MFQYCLRLKSTPLADFFLGLGLASAWKLGYIINKHGGFKLNVSPRLGLGFLMNLCRAKFKNVLNAFNLRDITISRFSLICVFDYDSFNGRLCIALNLLEEDYLMMFSTLLTH
jgi:hypothetical protein